MASLGILLALALGVTAGAAVNWAAYTRAYFPRAISPWSPPHPSAPPRRASDRLPLWGWLGLRRESALHGRGFWIRPLAVELALGLGYAALWWWEVERQALVTPQVDALSDFAGVLAATVPTWTTVANFAAHAVLIALMTAAGLIDLDEKLIPDDITIPGTLAALALAALVPATLLPHVGLDGGAQFFDPSISLAGPPAAMVVQPLTLAAPNAWPCALDGPLGLLVGWACYLFWCFALAPRVWRRRRGWAFGLRLVLARVARELTRRPLAWIAAVGVAAVLAAWLAGGAAWRGLLTALVGMIGGGAIVWAVRLAGSSALRREAMGFGDVTLMMMIGAFLGWQPAIFAFFLAPFAGLVVGLATVVLRRESVIAFGPYLCLGALAVLVRWGDIWNARVGGMQSIFAISWLVPGALVACMALLWIALVLWRNLKEAMFRAE